MSAASLITLPGISDPDKRDKRDKRDKKEKKRKERRRGEDKERDRDGGRLDRERRTSSTMTQTELDDDDDLAGPRQTPTFLGRLFHTFTHLVFISLLLLTIGSLAVGTSTLFTESARELIALFEKGLSKSSHKELALALAFFFIFLFILALTLLSIVLLIPALWVSFVEVVASPWSLIADYFLP